MSKYLISRTLDPLFALLIGTAAAWNRIRREELSRFSLQHADSPLDSATTGSPSLGLAASPSYSSAKGEAGTPPTSRDTLEALGRRLRKVQFDPRKWQWEWRDLWRKRERWGIVDPNG